MTIVQEAPGPVALGAIAALRERGRCKNRFADGEKVCLYSALSIGATSVGKRISGLQALENEIAEHVKSTGFDPSKIEGSLGSAGYDNPMSVICDFNNHHTDNEIFDWLGTLPV